MFRVVTRPVARQLHTSLQRHAAVLDTPLIPSLTTSAASIAPLTSIIPQRTQRQKKELQKILTQRRLYRQSLETPSTTYWFWLKTLGSRKSDVWKLAIALRKQVLSKYGIDIRTRLPSLEQMWKMQEEAPKIKSLARKLLQAISAKGYTVCPSSLASQYVSYVQSLTYQALRLRREKLSAIQEEQTRLEPEYERVQASRRSKLEEFNKRAEEGLKGRRKKA